MRTILAPGVEITEVDLSQYAPAATGTGVLVMGFANKGEDYEAMEMTSRSAFVNYFGEPTNEAERYFYNAAMEVINQNGRLYASKLPYDNAARDKYTFKKYTVTNAIKNIGTVNDYLTSSDLTANSATDFLAGDFLKFNYYADPEGQLTPTQRAFIDNFNSIKTYANDIQGYIATKSADSTAFRLVYQITESDQDDNWLYYSYSNIYSRLELLLNNAQLNYDQVAGGIFDSTYVANWLSVNELVNYLGETKFNASALKAATTEFEVDDFIDAFKEMYIQVFGKNATPFEPYNFVGTDLYTTESKDTLLYKFLVEDNKDFFTSLINFVDANLNASVAGIDNIPYVYFGQETGVLSTGEDQEFNLMSYYSSIVIRESLTPIDDAITTANAALENIVDLNNGVSGISAEAGDSFDGISAFDSIVSVYNGTPNHTIAEIELKDCATIRDTLLTYIGSDDYLKRENAFRELGSPAVATDYAKDLIEFYRNNTLVTSSYDSDRLLSSETIDVFSQTGEYVLDPETGDTSVKLDDDSNFFKKYPEPFDSLTNLEIAFNKTITKDQLVAYANSSFNTPEFESISSNSKVQALTELLKAETIFEALPYSEITSIDPTLSNYIMINSSSNATTLNMETIDEYKTGESRVPLNSIYVVDISRGVYGKTQDKNDMECVGIVPVITTAANALQAQNIIDIESPTAFNQYNSVKEAKTIVGCDGNTQIPASVIPPESLAIPFASDDSTVDSVSQMANGYFKSIVFNSEGEIDRAYLRQIGLVVFKAYIDPSEGNKVNFEPIEAYVGSLDREAKDPATGASIFIDNIVNNQSDVVNIYSNCFSNTATRNTYNEAGIFIIPSQTAASLGFYQSMAAKNISLTNSLLLAMDRVFDRCADIYEKQLDVVVDGGISNIGQYIASVYGTKGKGIYDPASPEAVMFKLKSRQSTLTWRSIVQKIDNFCKNIRKDCMFVCDGLRPLCLVGNQKVVRPSKPANTIDANIIPYVKYLTGLNTSYGACYTDWFQVTDEYTGDYFWLPPSIKAAGVYIYTDVNAHYWDAPAGLNRGIVSAIDVAFSPTIKQAGSIYEKSLNYAINYPQDGIVLEGQKTLLSKPSAFDRVNVRRLFLRLERTVHNIARYFVYEPNTEYTRQRFVDLITPIFSTAKTQGGIYDYKIVCDETINTPEVVDRNEMRVKIGLRPTRTAEFIYIQFFALRTGGSFEEMINY
jgi:hypothetical protein